MWPAFLVTALLLLFAYGMARGTAWLDRCSDDEFRLLIWEAEPQRAADAVSRWVAQVLVIRLWAAEPGHVWLRIEGWILFPWTRGLERVCQEHLAHPDTRLILDLSRVRWISPAGRRLLQGLDGTRVQIQRWPRHLRPLGPAPGRG
ncbi:MAG: hypothetical protein ACE5IQ_08535 [Candidatus Methylomirabilales bacterium]